MYICVFAFRAVPNQATINRNRIGISFLLYPHPNLNKRSGSPQTNTQRQLVNPHLKSNQIEIVEAPAGRFREQDVCFVMVIRWFGGC